MPILPSPETIEKICSNFRKSWSAEERQRRSQRAIEDLFIPFPEFISLAADASWQTKFEVKTTVLEKLAQR